MCLAFPVHSINRLSLNHRVPVGFNKVDITSSREIYAVENFSWKKHSRGAPINFLPFSTAAYAGKHNSACGIFFELTKCITPSLKACLSVDPSENKTLLP